MLGIVEMADREAINAQRTKAPLDTPPHLIAGKLAGREIAVGLGFQHVAGWHATKFAQDDANPSLALAIAVRCCGVDKSDRTGENRANGLERLLFAYRVSKRLWHVAQGGTADAERSDHETSGTKRSFGGRIE